MILEGLEERLELATMRVEALLRFLDSPRSLELSSAGPSSRQRWSLDEVAQLVELYPVASIEMIEEGLGRSRPSIYGMAGKLGLRKTKSTRRRILEACGRQVAGHPNSIASRITSESWRPPSSRQLEKMIEAGKATRFKSGHRPHTYCPIGTETTDSKDGYTYRKVSDEGSQWERWRPVHHLVWEEHRGEIPEGHVVAFKNGDRADARIENLELLTRAENLGRQSIHRLPEELRDVVVLKGALRRRITMAKRRLDDEHATRTETAPIR